MEVEAISLIKKDRLNRNLCHASKLAVMGWIGRLWISLDSSTARWLEKKGHSHNRVGVRNIFVYMDSEVVCVQRDGWGDEVHAMLAGNEY